MADGLRGRGLADSLWARAWSTDAKRVDVWLGTGPNDDHGDDQTTTSTISVGGPPATGVIGVAGDTDWFRFQAVASEGVRFDLQSATFATVILRIQDQWGNIIASYSGPSAGASVSRALPTGDYYVSIFGFDADGEFAIGDYSIVATTVADDHGDTFDTATNVTVDGTLITMSGEGVGDTDMVRFEANGGVPLVFNFDDMPVNGVSYTLYDRYGRALHSNNIFDATMYVPFVPEEDGVYYISFAAGTGVSFNITTAVDDFVETLPANGHITVGGSAVEGRYDFYGDMDVFSVTLGAPGTYRFEISPLAYDLVSLMSIYDKDGFLIDYSVLYLPGQGLTFVVDTAGTYHIALTQIDTVVNHDQRYTLTATSVTDDFRGGVGSTGVAIINGATLNGAVQFNEDADWIAVTLNYGDTIQFHIESPSFAHTTHMYDSTGLSIVPPMSFYSSESDRYFTAYATGTYYISVMGWSATDQGAYTMSATSVADDFTLANRGAVSAGGATSGVLEFNSDSDIFAITVTAGQTIEFFADAAFRYDLNIRGTADNDFLAYSNSLVTNRPLTYTFGAAGTYYVSISGGYSGVGGGVGDYTLHATALTDDFTSNATRAGEVVVNGPSSSGIVNYGNDSDWFAVTVGSGQAVHFAIDHPGLDVRLELVGLSSMAPFNRVGSGFTYYFEQGGTYYVQASGTYYEETGGYTITATTLADDFAASVATTGALALGGTTSGVINYAYDSDWFEISLTAGVEYTFSLTGLSGGGHLSVYDENGVVISSINDTYVVSADFTALYSGVHYVRVTNGNPGSYTVSATLGPPPSLLQSIDPNVPSLLPGNAFQHTHYGPANVVQVYFAGMGEAFGGSTSTGWSAEDTTAVMAILAQFEAYLNIDFQITTTLPHADLVLTTFSDPNYVTRFDRADWDMPIPTVGFSTAVPTWNAAALAEGGLGAAAVLNAIGYAMGLAFPHLAENGSVLMEGVDDDTDLGSFNMNQGIHTIMSFNDGWATSGYGVSGSSNYGWQFGPMALDIAVLQSIFGANTTYNSGANTYTLSDTNAAGTGWRAIWDTGGADTIVYSGARNASIDLRAATLQYEQGGGGFVSSALGVHGGFTIANGVVIENATGGTGDDVITGNAVANTLLGNGGADVLLGLGGSDALSGGVGNDVLDGGAGADQLLGGAGDDELHIDNVGDVIIELANEGTDTVRSALNNYTLGANLENLVLTGPATNGGGNSLNNIITGNAQNNLLWGLAGNDSLDGGDGVDVMDGGDGDDSYFVDTGGETVYEGSALGGTDSVFASTYFVLPTNVENLTLTGTTSNGGGNSLNNVITGNAQNNLIWGLAGADTLDGGAGVDAMDGGDGDDTYYVDTGGETVWESSALGGTDSVFASTYFALPTNVENLTLTGTTPNGGGNSLNNIITGNAQNNLIWGLVGNDTLDGAAGADIMDGGDGDDTFIVDSGGDFCYEASALGGLDIVISSVNRADLETNVEDLTLTGSAVSGGGNALDNIVTGNANANLIWGRAGADTLDGGAGADTMDGGDGDDVYIVDHAGDFAYEASALGGTDTVRASVSHTLEANVENLTLTGTAAINAAGNGLANTLTGNSASNVLTGGAGDDIFVFASPLGGGNIDSISDFDAASELIRLDRSVFTAINAGTLSASAFVIGAAAADADDRIIYNSTTGALFYDADGNGAAAAIVFATLNPGLSITNDHFFGVG